MCLCVSCCSLACMCHSFHYIKRILETMFVHRISHGTMPLRNIFKVHELDMFIVTSCPARPYFQTLTYYSVSVCSRTVAITGAPQLGWRITLTTLSTPHPVSGNHSFISSAESITDANLSLSDTLTDYGQQQINTGLYLFLVGLTSAGTFSRY